MYIFSVVVALVISLANSSNFLAGVVKTMPGEVYLGTTHYWQDYFLYVSQFFQGASGGWLTVNRYTSEPTPASILFWPNVLLGKLGGLLGLSPEISYNVSTMVLSFVVLMTLFSIMRHAFADPLHTGGGDFFHLRCGHKAFAAFLFAAVSTSLINRIFVNGQPMWYPFELWKTPHFALDRLGAVPHQVVQTLLFLLAMRAWFFSRAKKFLTSTFLLVLLTTLNPVMSAMFLIAAWTEYLLKQPNQKSSLKTLLVISVAVGSVAWYYNILSGLEPHVQSKLWEASQQITTTPLFLLLSIGPVSVVGIIGACVTARVARPIHIFSIVLLVTGYVLFFSRIPALVGISNSRVLFPPMYAAWGILGALGLERITVWIHKKFSAASVPALTLVMLCIFLLVSLPTIRWEVERKLLVKPQERIPLLYLPSDVYEAFVYVRNQQPYDDIVLANPASSMDAMVPALSGHTSYTGHPFATIASDRKRAEVTRFFTRGMTAGEAINWLTDAKIRYVLFTSFDGNTKVFGKAYPFLKEAFSAGGNIVYYSISNARALPIE